MSRNRRQSPARRIVAVFENSAALHHSALINTPRTRILQILRVSTSQEAPFTGQNQKNKNTFLLSCGIPFLEWSRNREILSGFRSHLRNHLRSQLIDK